jgi:heme-degrading monooxygenase HmoA
VGSRSLDQIRRGPDAPGTSGLRLASRVWCGIASFRDLADARAAFIDPASHVPAIGHAEELWSALLLAKAHHGECNHLDAAVPGAIFDVDSALSDGPLLVMTTAGFNLRSKADFVRLIDFRRRVDRMRDVIAAAPGCLAHQVFAPTTAHDDGVTMSLWQDEQAMLEFAYRPGPHRAELDRQIIERTVDRSSFTRFRVIDSAGHWNGINPLGR